MSASTKWWLCGRCGFRNHPRDDRNYPAQYQPVEGKPGLFTLSSINATCEQCGAAASSSDSVDITPGDLSLA